MTQSLPAPPPHFFFFLVKISLRTSVPLFQLGYQSIVVQQAEMIVAKQSLMSCV